jgi:hypothetical protein
MIATVVAKWLSEIDYRIIAPAGDVETVSTGGGNAWNGSACGKARVADQDAAADRAQ